MAKDCPLKGKGSARPIKAIEDGSISAITASALNGFFNINYVDQDGFQLARSKSTSKHKPMPTQLTLGSFLTKNKFEALKDDSIGAERPSKTVRLGQTTTLADTSQVSGRATLAATSAKAPAPASPVVVTTRPRPRPRHDGPQQ